MRSLRQSFVCGKRFLALLAAAVVVTSCYNNKNLASFDLGEGRQIKIYTGWADPNLPIYVELFADGKSVDKKVFDYEERLDTFALNKYKYDLLSDSSRKVFVVVQTVPERGTWPVIAFDFSADFGYPVCPGNQCLDCWGGTCPTNNRECFTKFNQLLEVIESENPGTELKPIEFDPTPHPACSK